MTGGARVAVPGAVNPVGVGAGLDKTGALLRVWSHLGLGFAELGTVTRHPRGGDPLPHLAPRGRDGSENRLGLPSCGVVDLVSWVDESRVRSDVRLPAVGVSLGTDPAASPDVALGDLLDACDVVRDRVNYLALNLSSPTYGGWSVELENVLVEVAASVDTPVYVKVSPDWELRVFDRVLGVCEMEGAGIIAANTRVVNGVGVSDDVLAVRVLDLVGHVRREVGDRLPVIGVGGIRTADDAVALLDAGADAVQLVTGLMRRGPRLVGEVLDRLGYAANEVEDEVSGT